MTAEAERARSVTAVVILGITGPLQAHTVMGPYVDAVRADDDRLQQNCCEDKADNSHALTEYTTELSPVRTFIAAGQHQDDRAGIHTQEPALAVDADTSAGFLSMVDGYSCMGVL